jgi:hypothetical protein
VCRVRKKPGSTEREIEVLAYKYVAFDCRFICDRAEHCSCYAPSKPGIVQWYSGTEHVWPNTIPYTNVWDRSQACTGASLIDKTRCIYEMRGMDAPGLLHKVRPIMGCDIPPGALIPVTLPSLFGSGGLPANVKMTFRTCCSDPSLDEYTYETKPCPGIVLEWHLNIDVLRANVPEDGSWGRCSIR